MDNNQLMNAATEQPRHHLIILLSILGLTVFVAGAFVYLTYTWEQSTNLPPAASTPESEPFAFTNLPEAVDIITIPDQGDITAYDAEAYATAVAKVGLASDPIASPFAFDFQGQPFASYLEHSPEVAVEFDQTLAELRAVAEHLNKQYNQPPLRVRQTNLIPADAPTVSIAGTSLADDIYPFMPVIEAQLITATMIDLDQSNEAVYQKQLDDYFTRLLASGYIGKSDLDASSLVYFQYTTLADLYHYTTDPTPTTDASIDQ